MKTIINKYILVHILISILFIYACTDLEEEILDEYTEAVVTADETLLPNLVAPALASLRAFWHRESLWGIQEATSDECLFPTRGTDWLDNSVWQQTYLHTWPVMHRDIRQTWEDLNIGISRTNNSILNLGDPSDDDIDVVKAYRAQAKFLRAFYEYNLLDVYGIFPVRDPFITDFTIQAEIKTRENGGFYFIVNEVKELLPVITKREDAAYGVPTKDAALMLLAKLYLNKEVYVGIEGYDSCLIYLNELIATGNYELADDYFDMFSVENGDIFMNSKNEDIFVSILDDGDNYGLDDRIQWVKTAFHYNQNLGSTFRNWNGCMAPQGYLEEVWFNGTDTATDVRWQDDRFYDDMAVMLGFNLGQQYDAATGDSLTTRGGAPLIFTVECPLQGANEAQGIRVLKYPPRVEPINTARTPNDFVIWRYADALLMKAECLLRTGKEAEALTIVNELRTKRNSPSLSSLTLNDLLGERGRELYWEGHRRQDMIRFGTFLEPKTNKDFTSPETALLCPIPQDAIDGSNGTIIQNPGY